jgi:hypothetical protein
VLVHTEKEWEKKEKRAAECQAAKEKKREELLTRVGRPTLWCRKQRATCRMPTHLRILPSRSKIEAAAKGLTVRSRILPCSSNGAIFSESSVVLCPFVGSLWIMEWVAKPSPTRLGAAAVRDQRLAEQLGGTDIARPCARVFMPMSMRARVPALPGPITACIVALMGTLWLQHVCAKIHSTPTSEPSRDTTSSRSRQFLASSDTTLSLHPFQLR